MSISEITEEKDASLELHLTRGGTVNQEEYFAEKINEIDQELGKFDLENDIQYASAVTNEMPIILDCMINKLAEKTKLAQPLVDTCELLSEHKRHVPFSTGNPKGGHSTHATFSSKP